MSVTIDMHTLRLNDEETTKVARRLISKLWYVRSGCLCWRGSRDQKGYGHIYYRGKVQRVHRFAYHAWIGKIPKGKLVCHHCDVPNCCLPEHLWLGTNLDNIVDASRKDRLWHSYGERNGYHKLTWKQIDRIRGCYRPGWGTGKNLTDLAKRYNTDRTNIWHIVKHKTWNRPTTKGTTCQQ